MQSAACMRCVQAMRHKTSTLQSVLNFYAVIRRLSSSCDVNMSFSDTNSHARDRQDTGAGRAAEHEETTDCYCYKADWPRKSGMCECRVRSNSIYVISKSGGLSIVHCRRSLPQSRTCWWHTAIFTRTRWLCRCGILYFVMRSWYC